MGYNIIVQAGGKGTRLEGLTKNKPKCLVPYDNLPLIFHLFKKFPKAKFTIIADYKVEVLQKYLDIFAQDYEWRILPANGSGTVSGIGEAIKEFSEDESFMVIWCDLILSSEFSLPCGLSQSKHNVLNSTKQSTKSAKLTPPPHCQQHSKLKISSSQHNSKSIVACEKDINRHDLTSSKPASAENSQNFVGISGDFECRWSFENGKFVHKASFENGVAGLFIFANKKCLKSIPKDGALVEWLQTREIEFSPLDLKHSKEIGTLLVYNELNPQNLTRPFNKIEFKNQLAVKTPIDAQGRDIAAKEVAWYRFVNELNFTQIPQIYDYAPLTMKKIAGKNIFEYECLLKSQKKEILQGIINALEVLHALSPKRKANDTDSEQTYITKTFERLDLIAPLVPFSDKEFIKINARYYKNPLFEREKIARLARTHFAREFALIHGDCTFSNMLFDSFNEKVVLIDPRGYFGKTQFFGDTDYDWAKLYYSICGDYDQFNRKKFALLIKENEAEMMIKTSGWSDMEECFFDMLPSVSKDKIKLLHALIWLSLTSYAWDDYDSICAAFYRGTMLLEGTL